MGGRLALPGSAAYHAAKWAVGGFTKALAQEVAPFGVKVCALEPGGILNGAALRACIALNDLTSVEVFRSSRDLCSHAGLQGRVSTA